MVSVTNEAPSASKAGVRLLGTERRHGLAAYRLLQCLPRQAQQGLLFLRG